MVQVGDVRCYLLCLLLDHGKGFFLHAEGGCNAKEPFFCCLHPVRLPGPAVRDAEPFLHQVAQFLSPVIAPRSIQFDLAGMPDLLDSAASRDDGVCLDSDEGKQPFDLVKVPGELGWGRAPAGTEDVDGSFHSPGRRVHQLHDQLERILVSAPEITPESLASERQHPAADQLLGFACDALDIIPDDPGAAAGEDDDQVRMVLCVGFLHRFKEFSFASVDDVAFIKGGACGRFERDPADLAAFPGPDKIGHVERAARWAMDEGDDMADTADDVVGGEKFAHGGMRGLQLRDHLTGFHFSQQLLQGSMEDDGIILHDWHTLPSRTDGYIVRDRDPHLVRDRVPHPSSGQVFPGFYMGTTGEDLNI
ncbi:MAG: hypothetical protein BWY93_00760 [Euryarchaeota archaeon ADurb.BinA087]|nr:MAG: hypothetical protein BWY93_00760 [Euryarchaeota archaeon ADurb.BinA087]